MIRQSPIICFFIATIFLFILLMCYDIANYPHTHYQLWEQFYEVASNILIGLAISFFFYFLVVHLPEHRKRKHIKSNFRDMYAYIKRNILHQIIHTSHMGGMSYEEVDADSKTIERLMDVEEFKAVFAGGRQSNEGWYAFLNGINSNDVGFDEIIFNLKILSKQVNFILQNYTKLDKRTFNFLHILDVNILSLERCQPADDELKTLSHFLWEMFSGGNINCGYLGYDPIEKMIDDL